MSVDYASAKTAFTEIYDNKIWGGGSGASASNVTLPYMALLRKFLRLNNIRSVVDVGCGDWQFSRELDWSGIIYSGFDVVQSVVAENQKSFAKDDISFHLLASIDALPKADLVVCKDVLQHLPLADIQTYLALFTSRYKFALVTNDCAAVIKSDGGEEPIPESSGNVEVTHGGWRPLRLEMPPFNAKCAAILDWDIVGPTMQWTKRTYILLESA